ncbi:MAG: hypothetical protein COB53_11580 [Elusimicrobia bacterium]|nr:MAG: hypothetical protein COB53_11580 [Elusimicrobiota bacterium]
MGFDKIHPVDVKGERFFSFAITEHPAVDRRFRLGCEAGGEGDAREIDGQKTKYPLGMQRMNEGGLT